MLTLVAPYVRYCSFFRFRVTSCMMVCICRFFLFSDQLVYAHQLFSGDWKMHEQLLLALVKVVDVKVQKKKKRNAPW